MVIIMARLTHFQKMEKNPEVFCNPDQPLIKATRVSQLDLDKQEARVIETRKRLADAMTALHG